MGSDVGRALLVEDSPTYAMYLLATLANVAPELQVTHMDRLDGALRRLDDGDVEIVLLDLNLPDSAGLRTLDRVQEAAPEVPVVVLSGMEDEELSVCAVERGAQDYVVKGSVEGQVLARVLRYALERKRIQRDLQRTLAELERSNADLEQFANAVSHDLQQPLQTALCFLDLAVQEAGEQLGPELCGYIESAARSTQHLGGLVRDILRYSRVARGAERTEQVADAQEVFDRVVESLQGQIGETGATVIGGALPLLRVDPSQLRQLLQNLVGNALKFRGSAPPRVEVTAERRGASWLLCVSDNGIGIPPEAAERVFEVFHRLHARERYDGTGIGLAICKKIVERAGGEIRVESEPGLGATFLFTLPAARQPRGSTQA